MSQCTLQSNRPKTVIRLGNDTPLLFALTTSLGEVINLNEVANLSVAIVSARSGRAITPPWQVTPSGGLSIEFSANNQSIGIYGLRVQFDRLSEGFADGLQAYAWEDTNLIEVVPTSTALPSDAPNTISGVLAAITKGDKGDPGNPMELLDELSRQQTARLDEIATAQSVSLTSIGSRLSDEQRTALEELAGRLSREQSAQIAQQTERLSTEQASGLQVISDRLSSEQAQILERQGQERATAQRSALEALDHEVNRKYDAAIGSIPAKVTDEVVVEVGLLVPNAVDWAVQMQLPDAVALHLPAQVEEQLPAQVESRLPDLVDGRLPEAVDGKLPAVIDAKLPPLVDERISGAVETAMPSHLGTALPPVVASAMPAEVERQLPPLVRPAIQPAVEQVMTTDLATRVAQGLQIGGRNLALNSGGRPAKPRPEYNIARGRISEAWTVGGVYTITARISIKTDNPRPGVYYYPSSGHASIGGMIYGADIVISDDGWMSATYRLRGAMIQERHLRGDKKDYSIWCGTYNGVNEYETQVHWVMIEVGNIPSAWTPAPEDTYANLAEERLVALSQGRAQLWAQYGKVIPNSALSSEAQTATQRLWTNYDGAYNRLRKALQDVVNQPSEQAYTALSSLSDQYQTAASDLQAGMTEAMLSLSPAGQIDYDTLAQSITGAIDLDSESRLTIKGQPIGQSLKGADGLHGAISLSDEVWLYRDTSKQVVQIPRAWYSTDDTLSISDIEGWIEGDVLQNHMTSISNISWLYSSGDIRDNMPGMYNERTKYMVIELVMSPRDNNYMSILTMNYNQYWTGLTMEMYYKLQNGTICRHHYYKDYVNSDVYGLTWRVDMLSAERAYIIIRCAQYYPVLRDITMLSSRPLERPKPRGTWVQRPKTPYIGQQYIATDMRRNGVGDLPMWYNGQMWIDYEGHDVTRRYLAEG